MSVVGSASDVSAALETCALKARALLQDASDELAKGTPEEFTENKIGMLEKLVGVYEELFIHADCKTRKQLEDWVHHHGTRDTFSAIETLADVEADWDAFVTKLEKHNVGSEPPALLSSLPTELALTDAASGQCCRLADTAGTRLLVVLRHFA